MPARQYALRLRFNPRAREGRDEEDADSDPGRMVSIHAPVKGATRATRALETDYGFQSTRP